MAEEQPKWKRIAKGDRLPCWSFIRKMDGAILPLTTIGGAFSGQDAYYLPVDEVINVIKDYPIEESKDEMIKEKIIATIHLYYGEPLEKEAKEMIAWLEKQGEHAKFRDSIQVGDKVTRNEDGVLVNLSQLNRVAKKDEKQGEQKPAVIIPKFRVGDEIKTSNEESLTITKIDEKGYWSEDLFICGFDDTDNWKLVEQKPAEWSEEDNQIALSIEQVMSCAYLLNIVPEKMDKIKTWLKSLKDRVLPQPKQEWSEEDEKMRAQTIYYIREYQLSDRCRTTADEDMETSDACEEWLKSLRPQSTWKPSEEQMDALLYILRHYTPTATEKLAWDALQTLELLLEKFKKLRK